MKQRQGQAWELLRFPNNLLALMICTALRRRESEDVT